MEVLAPGSVHGGSFAQPSRLFPLVCLQSHLLISPPTDKKPLVEITSKKTILNLFHKLRCKTGGNG